MTLVIPWSSTLFGTLTYLGVLPHKVPGVPRNSKDFKNLRVQSALRQLQRDSRYFRYLGDFEIRGLLRDTRETKYLQIPEVPMDFRDPIDLRDPIGSTSCDPIQGFKGLQGSLVF